MKAFQDEQEAYEFYKTNFLCHTDHNIRLAFLDGLVDEAEHGRWFNQFLIKVTMSEHQQHHQR